MPGTRLRLLDGFGLSVAGKQLEIGRTQQRLLAYLGLYGPTTRVRLAAGLWPDAGADKTDARLRTALWRLNQLGVPLVCAIDETLALDKRVEVDVAQLTVVDRMHELLPGWYEDWVLAERDRFRLLFLDKLEELALARLLEHRYGEAIEVTLAAMRAEPMREGLHHLVISIHIAEGNHYEALAAYLAYRSLLGAEPSPRLRRRVDSITTLSTRPAGQLLASF